MIIKMHGTILCSHCRNILLRNVDRNLLEKLDKAAGDVLCPACTNRARSPWEEDPAYEVSEWRQEVVDDNTRLGYLDWVDHKRESEGNI